MKKKLSLLGSTGSIGIQTLDVIREHSERLQLEAVSAGENIKELRNVIQEFSPKLVSVKLEQDALTLQREFPKVDFSYGSQGLIDVATYSTTDTLVNAVLGSVGLPATLKAIESGKHIALANKETLVTAGHLVMEAAKKHQVTILPVDSEHSALFQALNGEKLEQVDRLILTASGGSFRDKSREDLSNVSLQDALNHPNWSMGAKITIDSATMMNKGLEVIEAHVLFGIPYDQIDVVLHRESIIHSLVEFQDTSVMAQLGTPDMRVPIQYALTYPDRLPRKEAKRLNLVEIGKLHFEEMNLERFKALRLAYDAGRVGGSMTTVMNAANESAVKLFLQEKISFLEIDEVIERAMMSHGTIAAPDLDTILEIDAVTRKSIENVIN
ncbi:1-deoxy-D-xylulose-5-phosphate reductoisomerase [Paenisporosarcina cavernae]|uniref:1-deoxy-D-xylulose 5-phosphate reductoisomerase n=1 Tax=Paenisporosarcina cavernae TaxID=2320858 RepID=A0A385YRZ8_9BACL|nr:1-deoxy-D-xylulose-5-phosphate reductoisomerase [Paenisporosarcina cavernae]AYC29274.1 1-deoxy-D-xylulose-5-phosphate reductoisomerase [Paenisporosarcina cavernae]